MSSSDYDVADVSHVQGLVPSPGSPGRPSTPLEPETPIRSYMDYLENSGAPSPLQTGRFGNSPHTARYKRWYMKQCSIAASAQDVLSVSSEDENVVSASTMSVEAPGLPSASSSSSWLQPFPSLHQTQEWISQFGLASNQLSESEVAAGSISGPPSTEPPHGVASDVEPLSSRLTNAVAQRGAAARTFKFGSCPNHGCARSGFVFGPGASMSRRGKAFLCLGYHLVSISRFFFCWEPCDGDSLCFGLSLCFQLGFATNGGRRMLPAVACAGIWYQRLRRISKSLTTFRSRRMARCAVALPVAAVVDRL